MDEIEATVPPSAPGATVIAAAGEPGPEETPRGVEWAREYVYGTISTLVAIGGLTFEERPDSVSVGGVILVGAVAIALAHAISHLVVDWSNQSSRTPFTGQTVVLRLREALPIVSAAVPALAVLAVARSGVFSTMTALYVAEGVGVVSLAVVGILTAREPSHSLHRRVAYVAALVTVGLLIVGLELVTHTI
jgi:hypothetical protein